MRRVYNGLTHAEREQRDAEMLALRKWGKLTLRKIGEMYGTNAERVRTNCFKAELRRRRLAIFGNKPKASQKAQ